MTDLLLKKRYIPIAYKIFLNLYRDQTTTNAAPALPNKFDMNSTSLSKSSANPYLKKSLTPFGKSSGPNHDPGVNSDDDDGDEFQEDDLENTRMEEDDMFRLVMGSGRVRVRVPLLGFRSGSGYNLRVCIG